MSALAAVPVCTSFVVQRTVCSAGCTDADIASAVLAAAQDDVICVGAGSYPQQVDVDGKAVTVVAADGAAVTIEIGSGTEIVDVTSGGRLDLHGVTVIGNASRRCLFATGSGSYLGLHAVTVQDCTTAQDGPAAFVTSGASLVVDQGSVFSANGNPSNDGPIFATGATSVVLADATFELGVAVYGGALFIDAGTLTVDRCTFSGDTVAEDGGAIYAVGDTVVSVADSTFVDCGANDDGGGVYHSGTALNVARTTFSGCAADANLGGSGEGGALYLSGETAAIEDSVLDGGSAALGGAIYASGVGLTVLRSEFCSNTATFDGGALHANGLTAGSVLANDVFQGSTAGNYGGAIRFDQSTADVRNNAFLANDCGVDGQAVKVEGASSSVALVNNVTAYHPGTAAQRAVGTVASSYNDWYANGVDAVGIPFGTGDLTVDPQFAAWSDDDLCDDDLALLAGSPLVDAGDPAILDLDGTRSDIGPYGGPDAPSLDADGDGSPIPADCDDTSAAVLPGADEGCDGLDTDCDGVVPPEEADLDLDGVRTCDGDCDDAVASVLPGATETCDGRDEDCDGALPGELDEDGDGFAPCAGDCDDASAVRHPSVDEGCNGVDDDCSGAPAPDEIDDDGDGVAECLGDCDDADAAVLDCAPTGTGGTPDPTEVEPGRPGRFVPHGCGCRSGAIPAPALVLALLVPRRRR